MSITNKSYRDKDLRADPNERFGAGPKVEWANAEALKPGERVLQLKLIYEVLQSAPAGQNGDLWELILGNPVDYRDGFRIDKVLPRERNLLLARSCLYRRLVKEVQS